MAEPANATPAHWQHVQQQPHDDLRSCSAAAPSGRYGLSKSVWRHSLPTAPVHEPTANAGLHAAITPANTNEYSTQNEAGCYTVLANTAAVADGDVLVAAAMGRPNAPAADVLRQCQPPLESDPVPESNELQRPILAAPQPGLA